MAPLRFVDLFCGIGGFHEAILRVAPDAKCLLACDIDAACQDVYEANFGQRPYGDIKVLTEGASVEVGPHDLLCAGFPCQPFSKSGLQRGIGETRGTLFYNILRVLEAKRPQFVLLENVRNLAGPRHRGTWLTIIENLRALGYRVASEPTIASPHLFAPEHGGGPQVRERVFVLAEHVAEGESLIGAPTNLSEYRAGWDPRSWRIDDLLQLEEEIDQPEQYSLRPQEIVWIDTWNELLQDLRVDQLPGFPIWADSFAGAPEWAADTPAWKQAFIRKNSEFYLANRAVIDPWLQKHDGLRSFPPSRRKLEWQAQNAPRDLWQLVLHLRPSGIRVKQGTYLPALVAITQTSIIGWRRRRITPTEGARLQGFDKLRVHSDPAIAYRQLGNAVHVGVASLLVSRLLRDGVAPLPAVDMVQSSFELAS